MDDYISRQTAIDGIRQIRPANPKQSDYTHGIDVGLAMAVTAVKWQETADVRENKAGSWVPIGDEPDEDFECDRCGYSAHLNSANDDLPIFCPNCGARMTREEGNEWTI